MPSPYCRCCGDPSLKRVLATHSDRYGHASGSVSFEDRKREIKYGKTSLPCSANPTVSRETSSRLERENISSFRMLSSVGSCRLAIWCRTSVTVSFSLRLIMSFSTLLPFLPTSSTSFWCRGISSSALAFLFIAFSGGKITHKC